MREVVSVPADTKKPESRRSRCRLRLLGGFELSVDDEPVQLPHQSERLCALLALGGRPLSRSRAATRLWADSCDDKAAANLRTALWSLRKAGSDVVVADGNRLRIPDEVRVDLRDVRRLADQIVRAEPDCAGRPTTDLNVDELAAPLLPEWDEEWLDLERERVRQLSLHALEVECRRLLDAGRLAQAIDTALVAVSGDPLRESAHALLIEAYLQEGNVAAARVQFDRYNETLRRELGLKPTSALYELIGVIEVWRKRS